MSEAAQYLLAVYILGHRTEAPVGTNAVAESLDRSPATVTETFQRLDEEGLVEYQAYEGVTLTDAGRERAAELHETYVTVSWFFRSVLDLDQYESEAMKLAGLVSPTVAERLAATLPTETDVTPQSDVEELPPSTDDEDS
jgi:DtxR family Mn-dependent transcriptional regulator